VQIEFVGGPLKGQHMEADEQVMKINDHITAVEFVDPGHCRPRPNRCTVRRHIYRVERGEGKATLVYSHEL
jgi:hypothetical protein